jgi:uncharacterized membrane protein
VSEKKSLKERRKELLTEYGLTFVCISFSIFIVEMLVLVLLINFLGWSAQDLASSLGLDIEIPETSGTVFMAYLITRALKIPQLILTAVLTPPVAKVFRRWKARRQGSTSPAGHELDSIPVSSQSAEGND